MHAVGGSLTDCTVNLGAAASGAQGIVMNGGSATGCVVNGDADAFQRGLYLQGECILTDCEATCDQPFILDYAPRSVLTNCVGNAISFWEAFVLGESADSILDGCTANGSSGGEGQTRAGFLLEGATNARLKDCVATGAVIGISLIRSYGCFAANMDTTGCISDLNIADSEEDGSLAPVIAFMQFNGVDGDARTYTKYGSLVHDPTGGLDGGHAMVFVPFSATYEITSAGLVGDCFVYTPLIPATDVNLHVWLKASEDWNGQGRLTVLVNGFSVYEIAGNLNLTTAYQEFTINVPASVIPEWGQAVVALRVGFDGTAGEVWVGEFSADQEVQA
jgi:hypothetical protein